MSDVNEAAVESSTPAPETHNFSPETFTPAEHKAWMEKGTIPDVTPASSTGDTKVVAPESAAGSQQEPKGKGADARKEQLNAEIRDLLKQRDTLKAEVTKPDVKAAPSPAVAKVDKPVKPVFGEKGHEEETYSQYEARQDEHLQKLVDFKLNEDRQAREKERIEADTKAANQAIEDGWNERVEAAKVKHSDYAEVAFSKDLPISAAMDGFILDSEVGAELLYYLGGHLDEGKAIAAMSAYRAVRALHLIEQKLAGEAPAAPDKKAPVVPITKAARPAPDLKATGGAPVDELKAAVEAGDMKRFNEIQDAKLLARRRG